MDQEITQQSSSRLSADEETTLRLLTEVERIEQEMRSAVIKRGALMWRGQARPWFRDEY